MDEIKLTVSQVAQMVGENIHTVRNWVRDFRDLIPLEKDDRGYNIFNEQAMQVMHRIKKMYREQKLTTKQIRAILTGASNPAESVAASVEIDLVAEIKQMMQQQQDFNRELVERLDRRDRQLTETLKAIQLQRLQNDRSWFRKLFGKKK